LAIPEKAILGLDTDPFCQHRFLSFGEEPILKLWDLRNLQLPIFSRPFDPQKSAPIEEARFSTVRSGLLGILGKDDDHLTIWQLQETERHDSTILLESSDRIVLGKTQRSRIP
jgi:hypothetical protein